MPHLQDTKSLQDKNGNCRQPCRQITDHHHQFAIVPVHHHACEWSNDQKRGDEEHLHQAKGRGTSGLFKDPDRQREHAHIGGKDRDDLPEPDNRETKHSRWTIRILHLSLYKIRAG